MKSLMCVMVLAVFVISGCRSTESTVVVCKYPANMQGKTIITTNIQPDGTKEIIEKPCPETETITTTKDMTPFYNKWVNLYGWGYGFKIVMFDPQSNSYAPCIEAIGGRTGINTMPVVGDNVNTLHENLYIEKSFWSNAASVVEVNRTASGNMKGVAPSIKVSLKLSPHEAIGTSIIDNLSNIKSPAPKKITE